MATKKNTGTTGAEAAALPTAKRGPLFEPFSWTDHTAMPGAITLPSRRVLSVLSTVRDLSNGAALVVEMVERDLIDEESSDDAVALLSSHHQGLLIRMAIAANHTIAREIEALTEFVMAQGERQTQEGAR